MTYGICTPSRGNLITQRFVVTEEDCAWLNDLEHTFWSGGCPEICGINFHATCGSELRVDILYYPEAFEPRWTPEAILMPEEVKKKVVVSHVR